jgi:integrase
MARLQERRALRNENGDSAETAVVLAHFPPPALSQKKCSDCFIFSSKRGDAITAKQHFVPASLSSARPVEDSRGGFHAFRHPSASFMDQLNVPMVIRQKRLGHAESAERVSN